MRVIVATAAVLSLVCSNIRVLGQADLADYFGFDDLEIMKIGRAAGPLTAADMDGDGHDDVIVVNNHTSRIELHYQKPDASPDDPVSANLRVNEFPEHWRFRRQSLSVIHRVSAVLPYDFDNDGLMDLIYAGYPPEIVFMRQTAPGTFKVSRSHRVRNLAATRSSFAVADLIGDDREELVALVRGEVHIFPMIGDRLDEPTALTSDAKLVAFDIADYDGDQMLDVAGIVPDDAAPVRLWLGSREGVSSRNAKTLGAELRFPMPPLREFQSFTLPGERAASIAVIEKNSKRIVTKALQRELIEPDRDREASLRVYSFTDGENRSRDHAVIDLDGDGLLDLVATDTKGNAVVMYRQVEGQGMVERHQQPSLSDLDYIAVGNVDDDVPAEVFVLSEDEGVVGRSDVDGTMIPFPDPLNISEGTTPVALELVMLDDGPRAAIVSKKKREYALELLDMQGGRTSVDLGSLSRAPETIVALDADQDGQTDLLLFTRDKPMTMLRAMDGEFELLESENMGQFGLVKSAAADNTAIIDVDGDGRSELLIASKNFVRAVRYEASPSSGISPGWQVVRQINTGDSTSDLVAITVLNGRIYAADDENSRLVAFTSPDGSLEGWSETETVEVRGFEFNAIHAGAFSGDGQDNILAVGDAGFAVIRLAGDRYALEDTNVWRTDDERRLQHELQAGDINGDGYLDLVSLDAGEQMCEFFTFSDSGQMLYATGFKVFESRLFSGGDNREYQPSQAVITDVTGDGAADLLLLAHDRVLVYPQMVRRDR